MLKYFVTIAQFAIVKEKEITIRFEQKVCVPVTLQREDSLQCSARVFYEDEAFESVYFLTLRLCKTLQKVWLDNSLLTVRFPSLPWKVADVAPIDAFVVPNDAQGVMKAIEAYKVDKLADYFWEINKELD